MDNNRCDAEWTVARAEKWRDHLIGMEAMLAPVDDPLIRALRLDAPYRIAEVGCGSGRTTFEIICRAPAGSVVHGFDISPALIDVARRHRTATELVAFDVADMGTANPPAERYDRLVSRFGVMFFGDAPAAFRNLVRWLAPSGRFAFAVWGRPAENPWMSVVRETVAEVVRLPPTDPDMPGPFRYADSSKLLRILDEAGYRDLDASGWRGTLPIGGKLPPEEAADFALASFSSFAEMLAAAEVGALRRARDRLSRRFAGYETDGAVRIEANVHIVTGASPPGSHFLAAEQP